MDLNQLDAFLKKIQSEPVLKIEVFATTTVDDVDNSI